MTSDIMPKILALLPQQGHHLLKLPMLYSACGVCALTERIILSYLYCCPSFMPKTESLDSLVFVSLKIRQILLPFGCCCDRKSRAACAQSFALWQQATIEITCHDHSIIACSRHIYVWCCSSRTSRSW